MKLIVILTVGLFLGVSGVVAFSYSGLFDVAATAKEPRIVQWVLENTRANSIRRRSKEINLPDISGEARLSAGGRAFEEMCSGCHGAPGRKPFLGALDMNPPPPDLSGVAGQRTPKELFWVVKNGIRMTGMPAWGVTHSDAQIWDLVAFMGKLSGLSAADYRELIDIAEDDGHDHSHSGEISVNDPSDPSTETH